MMYPIFTLCLLLLALWGLGLDARLRYLEDWLEERTQLPVIQLDVYDQDHEPGEDPWGDIEAEEDKS